MTYTTYISITINIAYISLDRRDQSDSSCIRDESRLTNLPGIAIKFPYHVTVTVTVTHQS